MSDEAAYKCQVVDETGATLDFAGFSVFVKGNIYICSSSLKLQ